MSQRAINISCSGPDPIRAAALSSDGRTLITAFDKTARISDVMTGRERLLPHRGPVNIAAFSPDGRTLTTVSEDRAVQVWDVATGRARVPIKHETLVSAIDLITRRPHVGDRLIRQIGPGLGRGGRPARTGASGTRASIKSVVVSPDGHTLATTSLDNTARIWDVVTGQKRAELTHRGPVTAAVFSPDGRTLVTASDDARTRIWDVATARERELAYRGRGQGGCLLAGRAHVGDHVTRRYAAALGCGNGPGKARALAQRSRSLRLHSPLTVLRWRPHQMIRLLGSGKSRPAGNTPYSRIRHS